MDDSHSYRRGNPAVMLIATILALIIASAPISAPAVTAWAENEKRTAAPYVKEYGRWDVVNLPKEFRLNTIHAALLPTGKVLLVAGSGNDQKNFDSFYADGKIAVLKTVIFDPETNDVSNVETPADLFCGGHAGLHSGNLLIAGGTSGYEVLEGEVTKPAGTMVLHNEDPDGKTRTFPKGTTFTNDSGKRYVSLKDVKLAPASKMDHGGGHVMIHHSSATVFVEAVEADKSYTTDTNEQYSIGGLKGKDARNIYGQGGPMTLKKQDYRGDNQAYEFNPFTEKYEKVGDLKESRWYPTLATLTDGKVIAVSGLDSTGAITTTTETYDPANKQWEWGPDRPLPTYPALFRTADPEVLFYSGSNAGYGPATVGRDPGFWNVKTNSFTAVSGLADGNILENSASVAVPPAKGSNDGSQSHRILVAGGGGVGESPISTSRTAIIDLAQQAPAFATSAPLPQALRYINLTVMPWDEIFMAGGSADYRARGNSYSHKAVSFNPTTATYTPLADEIVPRSYHAGSLLLPDGRVLVFGNDPLFADKDNTKLSSFEQRLEVFTPPQLVRSERPSLIGADGQQVRRGQKLSFFSKDPNAIRTARLIPPSSTTHVTNIEQRSVAAVASVEHGKVAIQLPEDKNLLPNGWYMLFVTNSHGTPNKAIQIQVVD